MGRNKEDIQDRLLVQMSKVNRKSDRNAGDVTLAEQLEKQRLEDLKSDAQKRAETPRNLWVVYLREFMTEKRKVCSTKMFTTIVAKFPDEIDEFHQTGAVFSGLVPFFEEKTTHLDNRI